MSGEAPLSIMVANLAEAFYNFVSLDKISFPAQLQLEMSIEEQGLFWGGDNRIVVTSNEVHPLFLNHVRKSLNYTNLQVLRPRKVSGRLSQDIKNDRNTFRKLLAHSNNSDAPVMWRSYAATREWQELYKDAISKSSNVECDEISSDNDFWVREFADSKRGFRDLANLVQDSSLRLPQGIYCPTAEMAVGIAYNFLSNSRSCILKPDQGEDGMGQLVPPEVDKNFSDEEIKKKIAGQIAGNPYLRNGNIIVEDLIKTPTTKLSPSTEWFCDAKGARFLYNGVQILSPKSTFEGFDVGPDVVTLDIEQKMFLAGKSFGELLQSLGYRGHFDIDFVVGEDKTLYAVESNLRRTGASHIHYIGTRLFGDNYFLTKYLRSCDVDPCVPSGHSVEDVFKVLDPILYPGRSAESGLIITLASGIPEGRLGYVIIGRNLSEIADLQSSVRESLIKGKNVSR